MAVSRRLRFEVLRRDSHTCRYCGDSAPDVKLTVDHVVPVTLGGGDEPSNLITACQPCNAGKSSINPDSELVEDVDAAALLWARAMERAMEIHSTHLAELNEICEAVDFNWQEWRSADDRIIDLPDDWRSTIERFVRAGLNADQLDHLMEVAMTSKAPPWEKYRYFCGCCWRTITDIQETARRLLEDEEV